MQLFEFLLAVEPASGIAFPENFAVGTDEVGKRPGGDAVGFAVAAFALSPDETSASGLGTDLGAAYTVVIL